MGFDYDRYGAFKSASTRQQASLFERVARTLGFKNRYLRFLRAVPRDRLLLEIGCGNGQFLREVMEAGFQHVLGLEPSDSYVNVVDQELILKTYAHDYLKSCPNGSLGAVIALDVFEHLPVPELRQLIGSIHDSLSPNGFLIFRVPNMASPLALHNYYGDLSHTTPLNEVSIRQLVFDTGFSIIAIDPEPLAYPRSPMALLRLLGWYVYKWLVASALRAFGINGRVLTPNLVCTLQKSA